MKKTYVSFKNLASYTENLKKYISSILDGISAENYPLNTIYPVGSIYLSVLETSPSSLFGGTWERIEDVFLLACGNSYKAGQMGGESEHILELDEMPSHNHSLKTDLSGDIQWASYTSYVGGMVSVSFFRKDRCWWDNL